MCIRGGNKEGVQSTAQEVPPELSLRSIFLILFSFHESVSHLGFYGFFYEIGDSHFQRRKNVTPDSNSLNADAYSQTPNEVLNWREVNRFMIITGKRQYIAK